MRKVTSKVAASVVTLMISYPPLAFGQAAPAKPTGNTIAAAAQPSTDESLGEIVVTARRREERLQDVPVAVTVLSQETFDKVGAFSPLELTKLVPSFNISASENDRDKIIFSIRGQGQSLETLYPSVIPYFAEVPLAALSSGTFFDLQNVEILRGPQGTLFGRNTDGGAVLISPRRPSNDHSGYAEVRLGSYNLRQIQGALNIPIVSDKVLFRGAFEIARRDGFTRNLANGADLDNVNYGSFRGSLILRPVDDLENYTVLAYNKQDTNGAGTKITFVDPVAFSRTLGFAGVPQALRDQYLATALSEAANTDPRTTRHSATGIAQRRTLFLSNNTSYQILPDLLVKNIFGYVDQRERVGGDSDGSSVPIADLVGTMPTRNVHQITNELQLQGSSFNNKLQSVGGVYYDTTQPGGPVVQGEAIQLVVRRTKQSANIYTRSMAVFGQGTYDLASLAPGLKFTAGARYTWDRVREDATRTVNGNCNPGLPPPTCTINLGPVNFKAPTWTVSLDYAVDRDTLLYVTSRRGYKSGGFNVLFPTPDLADYEPEYLTDVEVGLKTIFRFGGMETRINAAAYRGDMKDVQRQTTLLVNNQVSSVVANLPKARVQGIEFEAKVIPVKGLTFGVTYAYTDAKYLKVLGLFPIDRAFGYTPKHQLGASASHRVDVADLGSLSLGANVYRQSSVQLADYLSSVGGNEPAYTTLNLNIGLERIRGSNWDLSLFATNVTNQTYRVGIFNASGLVGIVGSVYGPPRMFGGSVKYRF